MRTRRAAGKSSPRQTRRSRLRERSSKRKTRSKMLRIDREEETTKTTRIEEVAIRTDATITKKVT